MEVSTEMEDAKMIETVLLVLAVVAVMRPTFDFSKRAIDRARAEYRFHKGNRNYYLLNSERIAKAELKSSKQETIDEVIRISEREGLSREETIKLCRDIYDYRYNKRLQLLLYNT